MGQDPVTSDYEKHKINFYRVFDRFFGAKGRKLDENILRGYWKALGNYDINHLSKALDNLATEESEFMPDAGTIIAEIKRIRGYDRAHRARASVPAWCEICSGTGMVLIGRPHNGAVYETAYACKCQNGSRHAFLKPIPPDFVPPCDIPEKKLPLVNLEALAAADPSYVWDEGVCVTKLCAGCHNPYITRHERRVSAGEIQAFHINTSRPPQCEPCFIEAGRRAGLWV